MNVFHPCATATAATPSGAGRGVRASARHPPAARRRTPRCPFLLVIGGIALAACVHQTGSYPTTAAPASDPAATPPAAGANDVAPAPTNAPLLLDQADVQTYLAVMRVAAIRAQHPDALDIKAEQAVAHWSAAVDSATQRHAAPPAPLDEATLERSANLAAHLLDVEVASERGIDLSRYRQIRLTIAGIAAEPAASQGFDACRAHACVDASAARTLARDRRLLAPSLAEVRTLEARVHPPRASRDPP